MFERLLVCYDGSATARKALQVATLLAKDEKANLSCLIVEEGLPAYAGTMGEAQSVEEARDAYYSDMQKEAWQLVAEQGLTLSISTEPGHPAQTIVRAAKEGSYDLVVIGRTGHAPRGDFLGRTAEKVTRHVGCSVLIVR
jgi:nucleotide-binding universal stress UspA family protein